MKKERKLDRLYVEYEKMYSGKSQEEMEKIISDLEKEIAGKEGKLEILEGERKENLQKDIEQGKKRLQNLKGYSKNKNQIESIRKYKELLVKKLEEQTSIGKESYQLYNEAVKNYKEVTKKLADEKYTMSLDGDEYNALLQQQDDAKKEVKQQAQRYNNSQKRIVELQSKISKSNMAWKTLFANKDWDEIHRRGLESNTRFTRKVDTDKNLPLSKEKIEEQNKKETEKIISENSNKKESKALVEKQEGFFRRMWNKLIRWIKEGNVNQTSNSSKEVNEKKITTEQERDAFLEGLRQHVDVEYKKEVRQQKEEQYKETHKKLNKNVDRETSR